jgi:hypothetical protein
MPLLPDDGRAIIHGAKALLDDGRLAWRAGGKQRWRALQRLLDQLANDHEIKDRDGLADAIDTAALIYAHDCGDLSRKDASILLAAIAKLTTVLSREGNDRRIAAIMMDRDRRFVERVKWNHESTNKMVATVTRLGQINADLSLLALVLKRPGKRKADIKFHRTVDVLEEFWEKKLDRKVTRYFHQDPQTKRWSAISESMRFIESILVFFDPNDPDITQKLQSVSRHRLKRRLAKSHT